MFKFLKILAALLFLINPVFADGLNFPPAPCSVFGTTSGTCAQGSSLASYLPLAGGTMSGVLASSNATSSASGGTTGAVQTLGGISAAGEIYGLRVIALGPTGVTSNLAFGAGSITSGTPGGGNVAIGFNALNVNTGNNSVAIGASAGQLATSGGNSVLIGANTGNNIVGGGAEVIIGAGSGQGIVGNSFNTIIGYSTANTLTGGNNTIIGSQVVVSAAANTNTVILADGAGQSRLDYGNTTASVNTITGAFAVTGLTSVATTSAMCYNTSTKLVTYDGTIGTCTVSDERLKNIGPRISNALDKLLQINGVNYTWKDVSYGSGPQIGVGAQTVEKVFPELVQTGIDGYKSVDYQRLTAPIIEALRELKADNDNLHACQNNWKCRIFGK